jgi:hypothetical protein
MALAKKKVATKKVVAKKVVTSKKAIPNKKVVSKKVQSTKKTSVKKAEPKSKKEETRILPKIKVAKTSKKTVSVQNSFAHILAISDLEEFLTIEFQKLDIQIANIVRERINLILNESPIGFDRGVEWLDSDRGELFLNDIGRTSAELFNMLLGIVRGQYEADSWNEPNATFVKTARYKLDDYIEFG